jgi:hypothetical protein
MEVTGSVIYAGEVEARGKKGFRVQQIIIKQDEVNYRPEIPVEFIGDVIKESVKLSFGDRVKLDLELHGREWEGRWFLSAQCRQMQVLQYADPKEPEAPVRKPMDDNDKLPF